MWCRDEEISHPRIPSGTITPSVFFIRAKKRGN